MAISSVLRRAGAAAFAASLSAASAHAAASQGDAAFAAFERAYVQAFLERHPVVSTYLGGPGLFPALAAVDSKLRDWSEGARASELALWNRFEAALRAIDPALLSTRRRIDREVALHQLAFMIHQSEVRKYWQRSLDTYVSEAFRSADWSIQGMTDQGEGRVGNEQEWRTLLARVAVVPAYLATAERNLEAGRRAGNVPDVRMIERDGLASAAQNAKYFADALPASAAERTRGQPFSKAIVAALANQGKLAAAAFDRLRGYARRTLAPSAKAGQHAEARFALGEAEYDWALRNNLAVATSAAVLYDGAWDIVSKTREQLMLAAQAVARARKLPLSWRPDAREASTRAVKDLLRRDHPKSDVEMVAWYRQTCERLLAFGRKERLFDIPADYRLDVTLTPPALSSSIDGAAYYPAPPFKNTGVGRFYLTPTGDRLEHLKEHNRAALADLAAHEGFPGHDWNYKVMSQHRALISPVRWLTPGEVEGSSSMWQDSMAAEGWALYAESLLSEPTAGAPHGLYTPEELIHVLDGQLMREIRVRVDIGIHTGRMTFDQAVDLFSSTLDFLPGSCRGTITGADKRASCESSWRAIFRYSKWPTQAITYRLGKDRILALRRAAQKLVPGAAGRKRFHLLFMQQGSIPPDYFGDALLQLMRRAPRPADQRRR